MRPSKSFVPKNDPVRHQCFLEEERSRPVIHRGAEDGGDGEEDEEHADVEHRGRGQRAGREEERVARQEGGDHEPRLAEDDRREHGVGPDAVLRDDRREVDVDVQDEIDQGAEGVHRRVGGGSGARRGPRGRGI